MSEFTNRFLQENGEQLFNGSELLIKGAFETPGGVHLMTGYPGSPVAPFFDSLGKLSKVVTDKGICVRMANNEALSVAMVNGSQMAPLRAMSVFKSVGGHVAADGLALGNLAGPHPGGGAIIVFGDDPWTESTQVPADSRYLCQHLRMPVLEPSTPQEVKDYVPIGFKMSQVSGLYMGYIITTMLADGGSSVQVSKNHWPEKSMNDQITIDTANLDLERTVLLPPRTGRNEENIPERFRALVRQAEISGINKIIGPSGHSTVGFIVCGVAWQYLSSALFELGLEEKYPILKMGLTYPIDERMIADFASNIDHLVVVEERRGFLEKQISESIARIKQLNPGKKLADVWGKNFPSNHEGFPDVRGLHPSLVLEKVIKFLRLVDTSVAARYGGIFEDRLGTIRKASTGNIDVSLRTPTFCPGCPHRDSASALLEIKSRFMDPKYMRKTHHRKPVDLVFHGDTGCYTMLLFPPTTQLMHDYSGMGLGGGTGAGIDPFITNKQVVFMGDSTFFHSGQIAISNSIQSRQDITYIILDNRTTAMTGHQPTPSLSEDILGDPIPRQNIDAIVNAITSVGNCRVMRVDPEKRKSYKKLLERTILKDGVKVLIADKECGIVTNRRNLKKQRSERRKTGFLERETFMNITPEVCEHCLECITHTGCPGLNIEDTPFGRKMVTDLSWCVNDGACAKLNACPSFEQVIVKRVRPPRPRGHQIKFERLPDPTEKISSTCWRAHITGIGGMGIGMATAILVRAGNREGYKILFSDKKGLAIRNGGVYSQLTFCKDIKRYSQNIPYGGADLLIGLDVLEAARAVDPKGTFKIASAQRTAAVVNTDKSPTILTLCDQADFDPQALEKEIRRRTRQDRYFAHNITAICERLFGTKLYANITMLGLAYQKGLIPVSLENLEWAISHTVPADFKKNIRAFNLGRKLAAHPNLFAEKQEPKTIARVVREKANILERTRLGGQLLSRQYKYLVYTTLRACRELNKETMTDFALRIYELIRYENLKYAQKYAQQMKSIYRRDLASYDFEATRSVIHNLFKLMAIKDEFYVAALLTSYEKQRRDHHRYNVNPANGDKIRYKRTFHPRFFGVEVSLWVPHWGLKIMKQCKFIRRYIPFYHREDHQFLDWYLNLLDGFIHRSDHEYERYILALHAVDDVRGYREHRTPSMEKAKQEADDILSSLPSSGQSRRNAQQPFSRTSFEQQDISLPKPAQQHIINRIRRMLKM